MVTDEWIAKTLQQFEINPMAWADTRKVEMALIELQARRGLEKNHTYINYRPDNKNGSIKA